MATELDIPRTLPVAALSVSSINTYLRCPLRWKRRYVDREYEPSSGAMILGSAVGAAEAASDQQQIDTGERHTTAEVLDLFADEWDDRAGREEVAWEGTRPGDIKDTGVAVVKAYEETVVPGLQPVSVEREFMLRFPGVDWAFTGFLDLEEADGTVSDRKVRGRKLSAGDAHIDLQPTAYLLARRTEGNPAPGFAFHAMVKTKTPYAEVVRTERTDRQLDAFVDRVLGIAAEIHWRLEHDVWAGTAPGTWWCSARFCGYYAQCPFGGAR